ncbi:MAG: YabP/YqfC family sporulation protein [Butyricicoccaceae bacterium]
MERGTPQALPHGLTLQDRKRLTISGVRDVGSFDESLVVLTTECGTLTIRGTNMHVDQLSLESGDLRLSGEIDSLEYDDTVKTGLFGRLFG